MPDPDHAERTAPPLALALVAGPCLLLAVEAWIGPVAMRAAACVLIAGGLVIWLRGRDRVLVPPDGVLDRDGLIAVYDRRPGPAVSGASDQQPPRGVCIAFELPLAVRSSAGPDSDVTGLRRILRAGDRIAQLGGGRFAVALDLPPRPDLETLLQIAARLQDHLSSPEPAGRGVGPVTIGIAERSALPGVPRQTPNSAGPGAALVEAALLALAEARRESPGAIRIYSAEMQQNRCRRQALAAELETALASGQIRPWFQPQLSTDTGQVSGFEALARWVHPDHGVIPPADFLPAVAEARLHTRLTDVMLTQALRALRGWDRAGYCVPGVSVNLSPEDLADPSLADRVLWEADRHDMPPHRLTLEILESVVAGDPGDVPSRNITALSSAGCGIDLDDFGTGHASITSLRRFAVSRLKIDRSFVQRVDSDPVQQQMVAAILSMAERLQLETVAEGVETAAEHARMAELGCDHVQGYALARPMPVEDSFAWLARHMAHLPQLPEMGRRSG